MATFEFNVKDSFAGEAFGKFITQMLKIKLLDIPEPLCTVSGGKLTVFIENCSQEMANFALDLVLPQLINGWANCEDTPALFATTDHFNLSEETRKWLRGWGIRYLGDLVTYPVSSLDGLRGATPKMLKEIKKFVQKDYFYLCTDAIVLSWANLSDLEKFAASEEYYPSKS